MKYLAIFALLLTGCTHQAHVSDCFVTENAYYVVLEVGKFSIKARKITDEEEVIFPSTDLPGTQVDCYSYGTKKETK